MSTELAHCLATHYNLEGTLTELYGELDRNFLLKLPDAKMFLVKVMREQCPVAHVEMQCRILDHLCAQSALTVPKLLHTQSGERYVQFRDQTGASRLCWVLHYLPGLVAAHAAPLTMTWLQQLGRQVARLGVALKDFSHPHLERDFPWKITTADWVSKHTDALAIAHKEFGPWFARATKEYLEKTQSALQQLPAQAIHSDLNDHNVLFDTTSSSCGLIDFGDAQYAPRVCDAAITATYFMMNCAHPLQALTQVIKGYHETAPLSDAEIALIYPSIKIRLIQSLTQSHMSKRGKTSDPYLTISEQPALDLIRTLNQYPDGFIREWVYQACARSSLADKVNRCREQLAKTSIAELMPVDLQRAAIVDFSPASGVPSSPFSGEMGDPFTDSPNQEVMLGRYGEPRLVYQSDLFRVGDHPTDDARTVHAGVDIFAAADTPVAAPIDGVVHALKFHAAAQDYGTVVVLRHQLGQDTVFTLYGHLRKDCLDQLHVGDVIKKGHVFCHLGVAPDNGGWPPHLHFQWVMEDLQWGTDIPGVTHAWNWTTWKNFFPNPAPLMGLTDTQVEFRVIDNEQLIDRRTRHLGKNLSIAYSQPVQIVRGWQQYLFDQNGRCYLDAYNNVPHVGHGHPRVVKAVHQQMHTLSTNTRYLHRTILDYAERLSEKFADPLDVCFFLNSASEANELALRLARAYTGAKDMIVMEGAYHGHTTTLIDISPYKADGPGGEGCPHWVHTVPLPDLYRGAFRYGDKNAGRLYAKDAVRVIEQLAQDNTALCGFICESLPSVGGQLVLPEGYLQHVYAHVRAAGGVCIADEVQTGLARTGDYFWGFEQQQVNPDIVVLGKPMGNGHPLAAVVTRAEIADAFNTGMEFFSTFGGNTVSCAAGLEVLKIIDEESIQAHVKDTGDYLKAGLSAVCNAHPMVGDVRGLGLFLGVEMVMDKHTQQPAPTAALHMKNRLRELGILTGTDGVHDNVLKIRPPTPFNRQDADRLCESVETILQDWQLNLNV